MNVAVENPKPKRERKAKTELESRSFRDGAIYLFKRADYVKPTWFCRVKVPNAKHHVLNGMKNVIALLDYKAVAGHFRFLNLVGTLLRQESSKAIFKTNL